jgi:hypothetical protein
MQQHIGASMHMRRVPNALQNKVGETVWNCYKIIVIHLDHILVVFFVAFWLTFAPNDYLEKNCV